MCNVLTAMCAALCVFAGCTSSAVVSERNASLRLVVDAYDNDECTRSSVVGDPGAETKLSDCNIWIFDSGGAFLLQEYGCCEGSTLDVEKLFSADDDGVYNIYVVANAGRKLPFTPRSETGMAELRIGFDYGKFDTLGLPAAGQGSYVPALGTVFHLRRLAAKYVISLRDATAGGTKPYEFRFSGPDGKVVCRNVAKTVSPFAKSRALADDVSGNDEDVEFLSREELAAIDAGADVEKTLYLLENVWGGEGTTENVISGSSSATYLEVCGNGRIDADDGSPEKAGYCWNKLTLRYVFGTGPGGDGGGEVRRNTLNFLSLSVTNDALDRSDGWRVVPSDLFFDASMEFTPAKALDITDNDVVTFQAVPVDHWGTNDDIQYTLGLPALLPDLTVQYRQDAGDQWISYPRDGSSPVLAGAKHFRLRNFSPTEMKNLSDRLSFISSDGTVFSFLELNASNAKGKYSFCVDDGQGYRTLDRIILSPDGLPYCSTVLHSSPARFKGIRTPFFKEKYTVQCESEELPLWLWLESQETPGLRTDSGSYDAVFGEDDSGGHMILPDENTGSTRSATIRASFPPYLGLGDAEVSVTQIGLQSGFSLKFAYYGGAEQALREYRNTAERIWMEDFAQRHASHNWGNPSKYVFLGRNIGFGVRMDLKAELKVDGCDGAIGVEVSYKVGTRISRRGYGGMFDFDWPAVIEPGEVKVSYDDVVNVLEWPLTGEARLEVKGLEMKHYMDDENIIYVEADEEGLFYLEYVDRCLETLKNSEVNLHYSHDGAYAHDYLSLTPAAAYAGRPRLDLNTIYSLYGEGTPEIHLELR